MKKITVLLFSAICLMAAGNDLSAQEAKGKAYGKTFTATQASKPEDLSKKMGSSTSLDNVVVTGTIAQVCQAEGCWLKLKNPGGADILVKFKDHAFLVPKDIAGKTVTVNGKAVKKLISVEEQKHMAEDAGMSPSDMASITQPKEELRIEATGVVVL